MVEPFKFGKLILPSGEDIPYQYPNVWDIQQTKGPERLVIAPASGHVDLLLGLVSQLFEPFAILYVLLVSRSGNNEVGRYQSPLPLSRKDVETFLAEFRDYLEGDGRHHIWISAISSQLIAEATLVYDNHDVIYAYGPLDRFETFLTMRGLTRGGVKFPVPHTHQYNKDFDEYEERMLSYWDWVHSPLEERDDN